MRKLLFSIAGVLVLFILASSGVEAFGEAVVLDRVKLPEGEESPVGLERVYGSLERVSLRPRVVEVSGRNYPWDEFTFFFNVKGERILPGRFLRKYKGFNIELGIDGEGMVKQLRPAPM